MAACASWLRSQGLAKRLVKSQFRSGLDVVLDLRVEDVRHLHPQHVTPAPHPLLFRHTISVPAGSCRGHPVALRQEGGVVWLAWLAWLAWALKAANGLRLERDRGEWKEGSNGS